MVRHGYFEHRDFPVRLWRCGAHGPVVGETLGWSVADGSATTRIVSMWLSSPAHRAILLRPTFRKLGIGIATGPFKGRPHAVVVTVDFEGT